MTKNREQIRFLTILSMFWAIILIMIFTPIGFINLGIIRATIVHVPVIVGSLILGVKGGAVLGLMFGLGSFLNATFNPVLTSFAFSPFIPVPGSEYGTAWALVIAFVPRILTGVVPALVYKGSKRLFNHEKTPNKIIDMASIGIAAALGTLTNTVLVLSGFFFFLREELAAALGYGSDAILGWIMGIVTTSGVSEIIVAVMFSAAVCFPLNVIRNRHRSSNKA